MLHLCADDHKTACCPQVRRITFLNHASRSASNEMRRFFVAAWHEFCSKYCQMQKLLKGYHPAGSIVACKAVILKKQ